MKYCIFLLWILVGTQNKSFAQELIIDSLKNVLKTAIPDSSRVNLLFSISHHFRGKNSDSSLFYAKAARLKAEETNDSILMVSLSMKLINTALFFREQKKFKEAEELIFICMSLRKKSRTEHLLIGAYINLCISYYHNCKYEQAISAGNSAKELSLKYLYSNDTNLKITALDGFGSSHYWLGLIFFERGDYNTAIQHFTESLNFRNKTGNKRKIAQSLSGLARIYLKQNNYTKALYYFNESLALFDEVRFPPGMNMTLRNLGIIYEKQEDYYQALTHYTKSLSFLKENKMDSELHITYQMLGTLYFQIRCLPEKKMFEVIPSMRKYNYVLASNMLTDSAEYYLTLAHELSKKTDDQLIMVKTLLGLADISKIKKNYDHAFILLTEAVSIAKKIGTKPELYECYDKLSMISEHQGHFADAYKYFKLFSIYKDSVYNEYSSRQIAEMQEKYETQKKDREIELLNKDKEIQNEKLARQKVQRDGIIIIMVFLVIVGVLLFRSQHLRKKLEKQEAVIRERKRISADLHDDIGTGLSKISLLSELVRSNARLPETKKEAEKIAATSKHLLQSINEIIWALNSNNDYVENMVAYIRLYAAEYFENSSVRLKIIIPDMISRIPITGEKRRNIFYAVKEVLHNIIKHASATEAELRFALDQDVLSVVIKDNGIGIPHGELNRFGNGLNNIRNRMTDINGICSIENHLGTRITLSLPVLYHPNGLLISENY
jgi:signal transduction histidine kinase